MTDEQSAENGGVNFKPGRDRPGRTPAIQRERHRLRPISEMPIDDGTQDLRLHIPKSRFPDQFDLQWITTSVFGQPTNGHRARHERMGWEPVLQGDFEGSLDEYGTGQPGAIEHEGMTLYARPRTWSAKARERDLARAVGAVQIKEAQIRGGEAASEGGVSAGFSTDHPSLKGINKVTRQVRPMAGFPVPVDPVDRSVD
jgi:hypothetical protein